MKQNIKRLLLVLSMIVCFFVLSGCTKSEESESVKLTAEVEETMINGAKQYLSTFAAYSDEQLKDQIKKAEKNENTVISTALTSWESVKDDLGSLQVDETGAPLIQTNAETGKPDVAVKIAGEDSYEIDMTVVYEKRNMDFVLTAESEEDDYGGSVLTVTDMTFTPYYSIGEKLEKAFLNMMMGMGTVFIVLIFISFIISRLKAVNGWEQKKKEKAAAAKAAIEKAPEKEIAPAAAKPEVPAPALEERKASVIEAPVQTEIPVSEEENLTDDLELVSVITAAICAAQSVPVEGLVVRSIRRKSGSNWKRS